MISIIHAKPSHAAQMHEIEVESFALPWSENGIRQEISQPQCISFVAVCDTTVLGHAYMHHIIDEGHIINIAVSAKNRRMGIASQLVDALTSAACKRGIASLTLEVRASNTAAIALYEKHGFIREGVRKNFYSQPTEDGIIMSKYL